MRTFDPAFTAHLESGATTLAWCWRVTRNDGTRLGFTDHDRDLTFDGTVFEAASGFTSSELRSEIELVAGNQELTGALRSDRLNADDLSAGLFDNAAIEVFRVNWQAPAERVMLRKGSIGEVRRGPLAFTAELRGLSHILQQARGRIYQANCDADLGDARCGVSVSGPAYRGTGIVLSVMGEGSFIAGGLTAYTDGWFTRGSLLWTTGANLSLTGEVRRHGAHSGGVGINLWLDPVRPVATGDTFHVTAGCDKQFATCRAKFANGLKFRGCPHMPGNDFVASVAAAGEGTHTGSSLFT